jgi:hypothetical protein
VDEVYGLRGWYVNNRIEIFIVVVERLLIGMFG